MATTLREKAVRAELLLCDDVLLEAWASVEENAWTAIKNSPEKDFEVREDAYHRVRAIEAVKDELQHYINDLKMHV